MDRRARLKWAPYRHLPYERTVALREVESLIGPAAVAERGEYVDVSLNGHPQGLLTRLTYFESADLDGNELRTLQSQLESSFSQGVRRRQVTRYSAHGLHEYRGKFNPQIVRAIGNIVGLSKSDAVLDPFCGSGTTLVEGAHQGWDVTGLDMNPLAVFISNAKIAALTCGADELSDGWEFLRGRLNPLLGLDYSSDWKETDYRRVLGAVATELPHSDYLEKWFARPVLAQASRILGELKTLSVAIRSVFEVILSDLAREVSYQDPKDLRIRRRKEPAPNYSLLPLFLDSIDRRIPVVLRARSVLGEVEGRQRAYLADVRDEWPQDVMSRGNFQAAIGSPPYATAMPYIDTQRLSLVLLGLIGHEDIKRLEQEAIGTREITNRNRNSLEDEISTDDVLPASVRALCLDLLTAAAGSTNGFRRKNMPALVYRYFRDMHKAFARIAPALGKAGKLALVVGPNKTTLSGNEFIIDTPKLLGETAESAGEWRLQEVIQLDAYQRYDMHQRNSIRQESLVLWERA